MTSTDLDDEIADLRRLLAAALRSADMRWLIEHGITTRLDGDYFGLTIAQAAVVEHLLGGMVTDANVAAKLRAQASTIASLERERDRLVATNNRWSSLVSRLDRELEAERRKHR